MDIFRDGVLLTSKTRGIGREIIYARKQYRLRPFEHTNTYMRTYLIYLPSRVLAFWHDFLIRGKLCVCKTQEAGIVQALSVNMSYSYKERKSRSPHEKCPLLSHLRGNLL